MPLSKYIAVCLGASLLELKATTWDRTPYVEVLALIGFNSSVLMGKSPYMNKIIVIKWSVVHNA